MDWARILAYITGTVDQELLLRNEYLAAENRIHRHHLMKKLEARSVAELVRMADMLNIPRKK
jgi:putative transposase